MLTLTVVIINTTAYIIERKIIDDDFISATSAVWPIHLQLLNSFRLRDKNRGSDYMTYYGATIDCEQALHSERRAKLAAR